MDKTLEPLGELILDNVEAWTGIDLPLDAKLIGGATLTIALLVAGAIIYGLAASRAGVRNPVRRALATFWEAFRAAPTDPAKAGAKMASAWNALHADPDDVRADRAFGKSFTAALEIALMKAWKTHTSPEMRALLSKSLEIAGNERLTNTEMLAALDPSRADGALRSERLASAYRAKLESALDKGALAIMWDDVLAPLYHRLEGDAAGRDFLVIVNEAARDKYFSELLTIVGALKAAGMTPNRAMRDEIAAALTSSDPERRREAYFAQNILNMARATHDLVLDERELRTDKDQFQLADDQFADSMFEGNLLRAEGKLDDAIAAFERAIAAKPSDGLAVVALANALMDRGLTPTADGGKWDADRDTWGSSLHRAGEILLPILEAGYSKSNPAFIPATWSYAHLWFHLANSGVSTKEATVRSTQALLTADEVDPNNPTTLKLLGRNFHLLTREPSQDAETFFKRAIEADPSDVKQRLWYGLYLTDLGRDVEAAAVFKEALAVSPDHPDVLEAFAFLLSRQSASKARAELLWRHALRVAPSHAGAWKRYGRFLAMQPDSAARAEYVFKQGLVNRPNDGPLWCEYAVLLEHLPGRETDAVSAYNRVLSLVPDAVEPRVRSVMHGIVAGTVADPKEAGIALVNEGMERKDAALVISGAWLGVLFDKDEQQAGAMTLLKSLKEHFGDSLQFLRQERTIQKAVASGNRYATWLDPLCGVMTGELEPDALNAWEEWTAAQPA